MTQHLEHDRTNRTHVDCCADGSCGPSSGEVARRAFLALSALGGAGAYLTVRAAAAQALGIDEKQLQEFTPTAPPTKAQFKQLAARGTPTTYAGNDLKHIGMPIGGVAAGRLYLGGDGKLWLWDVYTPTAVTASFFEGGAYRTPFQQQSPFKHGFALRTTRNGTTKTRSLDKDGFDDITFRGPYPLANVAYKHDDVEVSLDAYSPFAPTKADDSSYPATVLAYTVKNTSTAPIDLQIAGWTENPISLDSRNEQPTILRASPFQSGSTRGVEFTTKAGEIGGTPRPEIVFEDFERDTHEGWTVEGTAFGTRPVTKDEVPDYFKRFGDLHVHGTKFVTSHAFWAGDAGQADALVGKLISRPFTIERRYITAGVGGGHWAGQTCVNVVVDGAVVATAAGADAEPLATRILDVHKYEGKTARIELVDSHTGGWGHVNCDYIVFTDKPDVRPLDELHDHGTFALAALDSRATTHPSLAKAGTLDDIFDSAAGPADVDASERTQTGAVRVKAKLAPGQQTTVRFVVSWYYPRLREALYHWVKAPQPARNHYATRFPAARAVVAEIGNRLGQLDKATRSWVKTWYDDSTLPHWFLERTFAPASTLATTTVFRFSNGRFYGEEGEYCCVGTCTHVWNYAQSVSRLFPELERTVRDQQDLGVALDENGAVGFRGEFWPGAVAHDGQAGILLRTYREHLMSPDDSFLRSVWPRAKKALELLVRDDATPDGGTPDGIVEGRQHNTLDQDWYGEIPWLGGLYVAALRAGAAMAGEYGDAADAARYTALAEKGSALIAQKLWNSQYGYFEQLIDPAHASATNSNRGCFADQLFGELYARQLDLPRIFPADKAKSALSTIYRNNFQSDHEGYRASIDIHTGRWFAVQGEAGLLMCTWPYGGDDEASGAGDPVLVGYFNEVWTGQEYQVAAHLIHEGLVAEGLALTRAVYERYDAALRNPYNEIECSDHYARAMMSHAVYLAVCGYSYHGPRGRLGFAPKLTPESFRAAFTVAEGWGSYSQRRVPTTQTGRLELRLGRLRLTELAFETARPAKKATVRLAGKSVGVGDLAVDGTHVVVKLASPVTMTAGQALEVMLDVR